MYLKLLVVFGCVCLPVLASANSEPRTDKQLGKFPVEFSLPVEKTDAKSVKKAPEPIACHYQLSPVADARTNRETIGASFDKPLRAQGLDQWLVEFYEQSLSSIPMLDAGPAVPTFNVDSELVRAYGFAQGMSIRGVVALRMTLVSEGESVELYPRGYSSRPNWANKMTEYGDALNKAAHDLRVRIEEDLRAHCDGLPKKA